MRVGDGNLDISLIYELVGVLVGMATHFFCCSFVLCRLSAHVRFVRWVSYACTHVHFGVRFRISDAESMRSERFMWTILIDNL